VNRRITGDPSVWPIPWFRARAAARLPFGRALSIGCGTGPLERDLVRSGITAKATGVDVTLAPLAFARRAARAEGMRDRIAYAQAEARSLLEREKHWDAVFFHGSLHHFEDVPGILGRVRSALKPGGTLYLDEYVGRSRGDWRMRHLVLPNLAYRTLPRAARRTHIVRSPVTGEDPTEQIASADILPAVERFFRVVERRDYGGNLMLTAYPCLRRPGPGGVDPEVFSAAVRRLLRWEDALLRHPGISGEVSAHVVLWAEPRELESVGRANMRLSAETSRQAP
jgi:SAM-dependent methyltransferase